MVDIVQDELKELLQHTDRALYALASCTTTEPCPRDCPYTDCWYDGSQKLLEDCRDLLTKYRAKQTPMVVNEAIIIVEKEVRENDGNHDQHQA